MSAFAYTVSLPAGKQPGLTQTAAPRAAPVLGVLLPACFVLCHLRRFTAGTGSVLTGCPHTGFDAVSQGCRG